MVGDNLEITLSGGDAWLFTLRPRWSVSVPLGGVLQASAGAAIGRGTRRHVNERRNERLKVNGRADLRPRRGHDAPDRTGRRPLPPDGAVRPGPGGHRQGHPGRHRGAAAVTGAGKPGAR